MIVVAFVAMFLALIATLVFCAYQLKAQREAAERDAIRFSVLFESGMSFVRARSLDDLATSRHLKDTYDLQLDMLRKNYAKEEAQKKAAVPKEPVWVKDDAGNELDLNDLEIVS